MMGAFEKGQWVRVIDNEGAARFYTVGEVCQVESVNGTVKCVGKSAGMYSYRFEAWKPKVGDRVRYKNPEHGEATVIEIIDGKYAKVDTHGEFKICTERFSSLEPIPAPATPAALSISAGKFYVTRDGRKVGPMARDPSWRSGHWYWCAPYLNGNYAPNWCESGSFYTNGETNNDLIAEWVDEPATIANDNAAPAKFKVGDKIRHKELGHVGYIEEVFDNNCARTFWTNVGWGATDPFEDIELITTTPSPTAIVALIEDGQPKPNTRPYVHTTEEAAKREADRLAGIHKGQQFGVYVLTTTSQEAAPVYKHDWQRLAAKGERINAIKELRSLTGMQLKQAKDVVEHFVDYPYGAAA